MVIYLLLVGLCWGLSLSTASATVRNTGSCSPSAIQATINNASTVAGDTVQLPTCTYTAGWTTVTISKNIILSGTGTTTTVLHGSGGDNTPMFTASGRANLEIRNMTLDGSQDTAPNVDRDIGLNLVGTPTNFRVHHLHIKNFSRALYVEGNTSVMYGLIDHNTFTGNYYNQIGGKGALGYGVHLVGLAQWNAINFVTDTQVFIEDNTFVGSRHAMAPNNGAMVTFRYNTVTSHSFSGGPGACGIDTHGRWSYTRGTRQFAIYNNSVTTGLDTYCAIGPRGGTGIIYDNTIATAFVRDIYLQGENACDSNADGITDTYIWNNTLVGGGSASILIQSGCEDNIILNTHYFTSARPGYTPYTYPHPLQGTPPNVAPTVSITAPTVTTVETSPLTTLAGGGTDDVGVTSVTWTCDVCGSGTATCPSCGASATNVTWSVGSITLASGPNVISVVSHDAGGLTDSEQIIITYQPQPDFTTGRVLHLKMDEGSGPTTADDVSAVTGTLTNLDWLAPGQLAGAKLGWDTGSLGWLTLSGTTVYAPTATPWTIAFWADLDAWPTGDATTSYPTPAILRSGSTNALEFWMSGDTANSCDGVAFATGATLKARWVETAANLLGVHHVALVYNGAGVNTLSNYTLYVDNVARTLTTHTCGGTKAQQSSLFNDAPNAETSEQWVGSLDEVRVYTRALTSIDVDGLFTLGPPPTCQVTTPPDEPYGTSVTPLGLLAGIGTGTITSVTWANDRGGSGSGSGDATGWQASAIPLQTGTNVVTVTVSDGVLDDTCTRTVNYSVPAPVSLGIYPGFSLLGE